jgi:hypothetical protein
MEKIERRTTASPIQHTQSTKPRVPTTVPGKAEVKLCKGKMKRQIASLPIPPTLSIEAAGNPSVNRPAPRLPAYPITHNGVDFYLIALIVYISLL